MRWGWTYSVRQLTTPITVLVVGGLAIALIHSLSHDLDYRAMVRALRQLPISAIALSIGATAASFIALIGREYCGMRYVGVRVTPTILAVASFCGNALGNAIGLGPLSGGAIRYRMYRSVGLSPEAVGGVVAFTTLGSAIDVVLFAALSAIIAAPAIGALYHVSPIAIYAIAVPLLVATLLLVGYCSVRRKALRIRGHVLGFPSPRLFLAQLVFTGLDVMAAAASLWVVLPEGRIEFLPFIAIFTVATGLGIISSVPGGLGIFDALVLAGLSSQISANQVAAAVLAYRGIYFLLPLILTAALLAGFEIRGVAGRANSAVARVASRAVPALTPHVVGALVFLLGVVLMISGATPSFGSRLASLQSALPLWAVESANFLASIDGVILLFVVPGLFRRLDGAWWAAFILVLMNLAFALAKGLAYGEAAVTVVVLLILLAGKPAFKRRASLLSAPITPGWWAATAIVAAAVLWILFFAFRDTPYSHDLWWQFEFDAMAPRSLRATVGAITIALAIAVWQLLRPAPGRPTPPTPEEMARAEAIIQDQGRAEAMLALMGDKSFLFSRSGKAMLAYGKHGRSWIALFDPIGPAEEWPELIARFVELAADHGGRAAFYEIGAAALPLYLDAGLNVIKIGEEARIPLHEFSLEGKKRADLRNALARGKREGLTVEFTEPSSDLSMVAELHAASDAWLAGQRSREMAFSVAGFRDAHVARQHLALLRQNDKIVGLVSLMATARKGDATIGVMRHMTDTPSYAMRFLFAHVILHFKEAGFECVSLGMAPLAGVEQTPLASSWHRIAGLLRQRGSYFYNFEGLREFKDKFHPDWQPRYHAASGTIGPFIALADVAALVNPAPWSSAR
jgi:phosphatidylglycerol lysyltransferase